MLPIAISSLLPKNNPDSSTPKLILCVVLSVVRLPERLIVLNPCSSLKLVLNKLADTPTVDS